MKTMDTKPYYSRLKCIFFLFIFVGAFMVSPISRVEAASAINGKVYLDYTGNQTAEEVPVAGVTVGLYNSSNTLIGTTQITTSAGEFTLSAPAAGAYTAKIDGTNLPSGYALADGSTSFTATVDGVSASNGVKLYVKGTGGTLTVRAYGDENVNSIYDSGDSLLSGLTVSITGTLSFSALTDNTGIALLHNLPVGSYTIALSNSDFLPNGYVLWAVKNGGTTTYIETRTIALTSDTSIDFIGRATNTAGIDGVVAVDMDEDGTYSLAGDLPIAGARVGLYYQESSNNRVLGTTSLTSDAEGKFKFPNIGLGSYIVKLDSIPTNYRAVGSGAVNTALTTTMSPSSGNNLLIELDPSSSGAATMPQISGFVFSNSDSTSYPNGPDSGGTGYMVVTSGDIPFKDVPISLFKMNSGSWQLLLSQKTKANGSYSFKGLPAGDYKVVMNPSSIASNFAFVNDRDGKSPARTVLVGGLSEPIAPYDIILPSVTGKRDLQNFWFGPIATYPLYAASSGRTVNGGTAWGGLTVNTGTRDNSAGIKATFRLYEEDGVTRATSSSGALIADATTADGTINQSIFPGVDKPGRYVIAPMAGTYESVFIEPSPALVSVHIPNTASNYTFYFEGRNEITGRVFVDIVEDNIYTSGEDEPLKAIQLLVKRKAPSGTSFYNYTTLGTNSDGIYRVTNLPDGDYEITVNTYSYLADGVADLIQYKNNADGNTANSRLTVTGLGGATTLSGKDIWHILKSNAFEIKGKAYLDLYTYGSITTQEANGMNDVVLDGVLVELLDASGSTVLNSATTVWPACDYTFAGLSANTTYQVRASKAGLNAVIGNYTVTFGPTVGLNPQRNFLFQGQGKFAGVFFNDRDGNQIAAAGTEYIAGSNSHRLYQKKSGSWVAISSRGGNVSSAYQYDYLEPGEYRFVVGAGSSTAPGTINPAPSTVIVDVDQTTIPGLIDFIITGNEQLTGQNAIYTTTASKGVSGTLFLDINDNGILDSEDIPLTGLSGVVIEGFYAPYFYPAYNTAADIATAAGNPQVLIAVQSDGTYDQAAGDTVGGSNTIQSTNYILRLKSLPSDFALVNDADGVSAPTTSYLPADLRGLGVIQTPVPTSGQPNQDFLLKMTVPQEISGRVYYDANVNSSYDAVSDSPFSGATLELWREGTKVASTTSSSTGEYKFANIFAGTYEVRITGGVSIEYSLTGSASQPGLVISGSNRILTDIDFPYSKSGDAAITGRVAVDLNNNGILDVNLDKTGDLVLAGIVVRLYDGATLQATTTTSAKGVYSFTALSSSANYRVQIDLSGTNYQPLVNAAGTLPASEIFGIDLTTAQVVTKQDFLVAGRSNGAPSGGIGGTGALNSGIQGMVFIDKNDNGVYEPGIDELLPSSVVISLLDDSGNEVARTQSNVATGAYQIYNLDSGSYQVKIISALTGYVLSGDYDGDPIGTISFGLGTSGVSGRNFWYKAASAKGVEGYVYVDFSGNNVTPATKDANDIAKSGVAVELFDGTGVTLMGTTITDTDGKYSFPNLIYGAGVNYLVKVTLPSTDYAGSAKSKATGSTSLEILISNLPLTGSEDNHFFLAGTHKIDGKIWLDKNVNGSYDSGEELAAVNVKLNWAGPDGVFGTGDDVNNLKTSTTITTGEYEFTKLPPGAYQVTVDRASTPELTGTELISTSVISGNIDPRNFTVATADYGNVDFAFTYTGLISGKVVIDVDRSASFTGADSTMSGPTLTIRLEDSSDPTNFKTLTTTDGTFRFFGIDPAKTWKISVSNGIVMGYNFSFGLGDSNNTTAGNEYATVALTVATPSKTDVILGYKGSGKIHGKVVLDNDLTDGNVATSADTSLGANIQVTISSAASGFTSWTVLTAADGSYEITDLASYTYTVSINQSQSGFQTGLMISFDPEHGMTSPTGSAAIMLTSPDQVLNQKDFGYKGRGSISGKVLIDIEGGGTRTTADQPFAGITVTATQGTITRTAITNSGGEYSFGTIPTGIWDIYVSSSDLPVGYSFSYGEGNPATAIEVGIDRVKVNIDSALSSRATTPTLTAIEVNLGYKGAAKIGGRLIYDNDDTDGAAYNSSIDTLFGAGYVVTLSGGTGFTARTTTTNTNGEYEFTGLTTYADYKVTVISPAGYVISFDPTTTAVSPSEIPVGHEEALIPITSATETKTLQDFGFKGAGKIAGKIFIDLNDNGTYESAVDQPKSGITITLTHGTLPPRTAITDANGDYEVTGIPAGEWTVEVIGGLSGLHLPSFDYDDAFDSINTPSTPNKAVVQLTNGSPIVENANFGYINRGKISGVIKEDLLATGLYDPSAAGIAGVSVYLVENDGTTAKTYADGSPIILTTDSTGYFAVRNLDCPASGVAERVRVEFGIHSTGPLSLLEPSYDSDSPSGGYGSGVDLANGRHTVHADLTDTVAERTPADLYLGYRQVAGDIIIHKVAGKATAKIGDIVPYTITIENKSEAPALNVTIEDLIPAGFKYVSGSSRLDGVKIEDPKGNRPLRFEGVDLGSSTGSGTENSKRKLSYFLVVGSGVTQGEYTNSAVAKNRFDKVASNTSKATVEITSDPLFDDSLIFGKVYVDVNENGEQNAEEEGVSGVKLVTGRGEIITTDEHGRYHIPAVDGGRWERGRNFILKLDVRSLPAGYKVISDNPIVVRTSPGLPSKINFRIKKVEAQEAQKEIK